MRFTVTQLTNSVKTAILFTTMKTATVIDTKTHRILMGNEAMGRGIVEAGCTVATSYPGTPASEILQSVVVFTKETGAPLYAEWSVNEKVAYEVALANSMSGRRSAVAMKQVGLNVASDPFMRSAYLGVKGGLVRHLGGRPRPPQLPDRAGQPLFRHVRQGAGPGPVQPQGSQGHGEARPSSSRSALRCRSWSGPPPGCATPGRTCLAGRPCSWTGRPGSTRTPGAGVPRPSSCGNCTGS